VIREALERNRFMRIFIIFALPWREQNRQNARL